MITTQARKVIARSGRFHIVRAVPLIIVVQPDMPKLAHFSWSILSNYYQKRVMRQLVEFWTTVERIRYHPIIAELFHGTKFQKAFSR